jgi:hypothetical protein
MQGRQHVGHAGAVSPDPAAPTALDIADDTFVVAAIASVAEVVRDPASWRAWWPDLDLTVTEDRGPKGVRWSVAGAVLGSMEVWLEPCGDGVVLHWYLRADPARVTRRSDRERTRRVLRWKEQVHALKDRLEDGREPGSPRVPDRAESATGVKEGAEPAESQ